MEPHTCATTSLDNQWGFWYDPSTSYSPASLPSTLSDPPCEFPYRDGTLFPEEWGPSSDQFSSPDALGPRLGSDEPSAAPDPQAYYAQAQAQDGGPDLYYMGVPAGAPTGSTFSNSRSDDEKGTRRRLRTYKKPSKVSKIKVGGKAKTDGEDEDGKKQPPARESHNQVEKRYRDRLNDNFELLLQMLDHDPKSFEVDNPRALNKCQVLKLACHQLQTLEDEIQQLKTELKHLNGMRPVAGEYGRPVSPRRFLGAPGFP